MNPRVAHMLALKDHWNGRRDLRRGGLGHRRGGSAERGDYIDPQIHQFVRHWRQPLIGACRPAIFDAHVLAFDIAGLAQTLNQRILKLRRAAPEYAHYRHGCLLRPRRERPRGRRAAEECDEVTPSHARLPGAYKAYQRAALCVTTKWHPQMTLWVNSVGFRNVRHESAYPPIAALRRTCPLVAFVPQPAVSNRSNSVAIRANYFPSPVGALPSQ